MSALTPKADKAFNFWQVIYCFVGGGFFVFGLLDLS